MASAIFLALRSVTLPTMAAAIVVGVVALDVEQRSGLFQVAYLAVSLSIRPDAASIASGSSPSSCGRRSSPALGAVIAFAAFLASAVSLPSFVARQALDNLALRLDRFTRQVGGSAYGNVASPRRR